MDTRYHRHDRRKYSLKVHIVLVTKYRKQLLRRGIADVHHYEIVAMETDKDHVYILLGYDTTDSVCNIIKTLKQETKYLTIDEIELSTDKLNPYTNTNVARHMK